MMTLVIFAILLVLQGSLFSFPLAFAFLQKSAIKRKDNRIFALAFFSGLILDLFYFRTLGMTSLFFLLFLFAIFTYERKFEINNSSFVFISSFLGSMVLFLLLGEPHILLKSIISSIFALIISRAW